MRATSRIQLSDGVVDLATGQVERDGGSARLTALELRLLQHLAGRVGVSVSQQELLTRVWGYHRDSTSRAPANTISRLRAKVEVNPGAPRHLITEYGGGVRLEVASERSGGRGFIGRRDELAALGAGRLVCVVGPGGVGKSRLVREFVEACGEDWVWCELAACTDAEQALAALAACLPVADRCAPTRRQVRDALGRMGPIRVVLDNVEQLDVAGLLGPLLHELPEVRWLLTSRRRPGLPQERVVALGPLSPTEARQLFLARGGPDHAELPRLVLELEGSPLAIELAAARAGVLTVPQIRARLGRQLDLLAEGQGSLRASVAWSWGLLDASEKRALVASAAFAGGMGIDAAEALLGPSALDALTALVEHNLLRVTEPGRFVPYEPVRRFAEERVDDELLDAHARWFGRLGRPEHLARMHGGHAEETLAGLARERLNLERAAARGSTLAVLALAECAYYVGPAEWGGRAVDAALAREEDPALRRRLLLAKGHLTRDPAPLEEALSGAPDGEERARCAYALAQALIEDAPERSEALLSEARAHFEGRGSLSDLGGVDNGLGRIALFSGRHDEAEARFQAALLAAARTGDRVREAMVTNNLGLLHAFRGEARRARRRFEQALALHHEAGNLRSEVLVLSNLARLRQEEGQLEACVEEWSEALDAARQLGDEALLSHGLGAAAMACAEAGRLEQAERLLEEAERVDCHVRARALLRYARALVELGHGERESGLRHLREARAGFAECGELSSVRAVEKRMADLGA